MQVDDQNFSEAYVGDSIGLEVEQPVKTGTEVYKNIEVGE